MNPEYKKSNGEIDVKVQAYNINEKAHYQSTLGIRKNAFELLSQIPEIMEDDSEIMSARIYWCIEKYKKIDKRLSWLKYDKQIHVDILSEYKNFLLKYGLKEDAEAIQTRIDVMREEIDEKTKRISELWSKISEWLWSPTHTITSWMIDDIKLDFIALDQLAYEIGYDKNQHEFMLNEYLKFLENFGSKEEVDVIKKDIELIKTGYDKDLLIATFSEYKKLLLKLGFKEYAEDMQKYIDDEQKRG